MKVKPWMVQKDEEEATSKRYSVLVDSSSIDVVGQVQICLSIYNYLDISASFSLCSGTSATLIAFASPCVGGDEAGT